MRRRALQKSKRGYRFAKGIAKRGRGRSSGSGSTSAWQNESAWHWQDQRQTAWHQGGHHGRSSGWQRDDDSSDATHHGRSSGWQRDDDSDATLWKEKFGIWYRWNPDTEEWIRSG